MNDRPGRILFLIGQLGRGGAERQLLELTRELTARGIEIAVGCLSREADFLPEFLEAGARVEFLDKRRGVDPAAAARIVRLIQREAPDLVHAFMPVANFWGALALAFFPALPFVASERTAALSGNLESRVRFRVIRQRAAAVIVNAEAVAARLRELYRFPQGQVHVVRNGIRMDRFPADLKAARAEARARFGVSAVETVVVQTANFSPVKDHETALKAAEKTLAACPGARFWFVGSGPGEETARQRAERSPLKGRVLFFGRRGDVERILPGADIALLTSLSEGLPNALLEAMAAGLPAVATDVGGCREAVADGETGFLVPPRDADRVAERLIQLIQDRGLAARMGENGKRRVTTEFSVEALADRTLAVYSKVIAPRRVGSA